MNKFFGFLGFVFLYLGLTLFIQATSSTYKMWEETFMSNVFADIFFDNQWSSTWYNANSPTATANISASYQILPPPPPPVSRHSH